MKMLFDFFRERFNQKGSLPFAPGSHMIQSAMRALRSGAREETVLACLLHDVGFALHAADHGYWGAQLIAPYVSEKVAWAVRYHQALRFYPDPEVGYEYPESYRRIFGPEYTGPTDHPDRDRRAAARIYSKFAANFQVRAPPTTGGISFPSETRTSRNRERGARQHRQCEVPARTSLRRASMPLDVTVPGGNDECLT